MDTHDEQGDVEGCNDIEAQSGEYVDIGGNESENIDGQCLDGDDDLSVKADIHVDGGVDINSSLCMEIEY